MRSEIIRSAQVWVCDACGCQDAKSCGCNSTAHQEELAAKKEATRQANRRSREKAKENQTARYNIADVENIEEFEDAESELDEDPENYRSAFLLRADSALKFAVYSGPILTNEMISAARAVAAKWSKLAQDMESRHGSKEKDGLDIPTFLPP